MLVLLATGDKEAATRTVETAAEYIAEFATRARQGCSAGQQENRTQGG